MKLKVLAGDIGGTKTNLRLVTAEVRDDGSASPSLTTLREQTYVSRKFADLVPMVHQFFNESGGELTADTACFGIAGAIVDNTSLLTNLNWSLSGERLQKSLNIPQVTLINDFAAIGHGIAGLGDGQIETLQEGIHDPAAPIAVIGAGTGLGEGFLIPCPDGSLKAFPSEGGHTDFAPKSRLEFQLLTYLMEKHNLPRVSAERVVSGKGIASIYQFFRDTNPREETAAMADIFQAWSREMGRENKTIDLASEVSKATRAGNDFLCEQTMNMFIAAYGSEAGDLALQILPFGGLYLAGGIAPKNVEMFRQETFIKAFCSKGRMRPLLEKIPVHVILDPKVALIGAALTAVKNY